MPEVAVKKYLNTLEDFVDSVSTMESQNIENTLKKLLENEKSTIGKQIETLNKKKKIFEKKYNLDSNKFYDKFENKELGDSQDYFEWFAIIDSIKRLENQYLKISKVIN